MVAIINARIFSGWPRPLYGEGEGEGNPFEASWRLRRNPSPQSSPLAQGERRLEIAAP